MLLSIQHFFCGFRHEALEANERPELIYSDYEVFQGTKKIKSWLENEGFALCEFLHLQDYHFSRKELGLLASVHLTFLLPPFKTSIFPYLGFAG